MLGAIAGDIVGSVYEHANIKHKDFPLFHPQARFTDDTVLTVAVAEALLTGTDYAGAFKDYYRRYPRAGYGARFQAWAQSEEAEPYYSWGNGSAMRVSPVAYAFDDLAAVLAEAKRSAAATHNHPEGIKGAQAVAAAIFLARTGAGKSEIQDYIQSSFGYDLDQTLAAIRPHYSFDVSCQGSVPQAIRAFLEAEDFEDAVRNAVSLGGDSDTLACMAGGIAEAFFGLPEAVAEAAKERLDPSLEHTVKNFRLRFR